MAVRKKVAAAGTSTGKVDLPKLITQLDEATGDGRMDKVKSMLKADRFQLFSEVASDHVTGVVKSQTDPALIYACKLDDRGHFMCCTQNLNVCGGLRGKPCKHLLVLVVGLAQAGEAEADLLSKWTKATSGKKPALDKDAMSATFVKYKGAEAGEIDWRPTETIPEDYYAL
jgi:hypothetical protein